MSSNYQNETISKLLSTQAGRLKLARAMVLPTKRPAVYGSIRTIDIHEDYIIKLHGDTSTCICTKQFNVGNFSQELPEIGYFSGLTFGNYYTLSNKIVYILYNNESIKNFNDFKIKILAEFHNLNIKSPEDKAIIIDYEMINCLERYYKNAVLL